MHRNSLLAWIVASCVLASIVVYTYHDQATRARKAAAARAALNPPPKAPIPAPAATTNNPPSNTEAASVIQQYVQGGYQQTSFELNGWTMKLLDKKGDRLTMGGIHRDDHFYYKYMIVATRKSFPQYQYNIDADTDLETLKTSYAIGLPTPIRACDDGSKPTKDSCADGTKPQTPIIQ